MSTRLMIYICINILKWIVFVFRNFWGNFRINGWKNKNVRIDTFCIIGGLITGIGLGYVISLLPLTPITNGVLLIVSFASILNYVLTGYGYRRWERSPYAHFESFPGYLLVFQAGLFVGEGLTLVASLFL